MDRQKSLSILLVMMTLGSAWAIRGRFGHEWGAAWAGSIGVLSLIAVSGRKDWLRNWPVIATIGALGWGMTGMISYGQVVGYGKSTDLFNATYGLYCLLLIGGLFGFLGGGLTGILLETSKEKRPEWASLVTQMVAGGYLFWGALIYQFEWLMTPPRSELWAGSLGAAGALGWYMKRKSFENAWRVAMFSMLGGGFGFAFGNFIQTIGITLGISFNWWNAMEYSIGCFGGLGMAYGVFSQEWEDMPKVKNSAIVWSSSVLLFLIPVLTISNAFTSRKLTEVAQQLGIDHFARFTMNQWILVLSLSVISFTYIFWKLLKSQTSDSTRQEVVGVLGVAWIWYYGLRVISTGTFYQYAFSSDDLIIPNFILVFYFLIKRTDWRPFTLVLSKEKLNNQIMKFMAFIILLILILAMIASKSHDALPGSKERFSFDHLKTTLAYEALLS